MAVGTIVGTGDGVSIGFGVGVTVGIGTGVVDNTSKSWISSTSSTLFLNHMYQLQEFFFQLMYLN